MACLLLRRSHLNGSVSLDIICCVHSLFWACTDGDLHGHHFQKCRLPQTRCSSFLLWDPVLFFLFLTLETKLLQTLSSGMQLCSFLSSDMHPDNISAVNGAEPSQWQLLPFMLPVPSNLVFSDLCIPTSKIELSHTLPWKQNKKLPRGVFNDGSVWMLVSSWKGLIAAKWVWSVAKISCQLTRAADCSSPPEADRCDVGWSKLSMSMDTWL